ncbi:hypothetical protein O6H91_01G050000 [Diphasiastrum complanatum]|uniref:Uncharacterized protein n=1 Tax=Diphasiastrum complanatum TaxID=34168 RepID=A0ACC2EQY3_DIPCM|nr:hypothetical protein O6H91_01G050000 [Diphasiastrum complanatum]
MKYIFSLSLSLFFSSYSLFLSRLFYFITFCDPFLWIVPQKLSKSKACAISLADRHFLDALHHNNPQILKHYIHQQQFSPRAKGFIRDIVYIGWGIASMGLAHQVPVSFDNVRDKNVMLLKKLNAAIFPIKYQDNYYSDAIASGDYTRLAYYGDICVGNIACRLEKKDGGGLKLYIMTLGVLAPYRRLGIGSKLLKNMMDLCQQDPNLVEIYLHVQTNNDEAIAFYKRFGFEITDTIQNYYNRIEPPDCYVLSKTLTPLARAKQT